MKKNFTPRGFTLIEVLIYIVLFGMLMSGAVVAAYALLQSGQAQELNFLAQQEGTFINRKLAWALTPASAASVDASGKILTITRPDMGSASPLIFDGSGTQMTLARGTTGAQALIPEGLTLADVHFEVEPAANNLPSSVHALYVLGGKEFSYAMYLRK